MNKEVFCVIMAGGAGSRFWPLSKNKTPKQFLDIFGMGKSLIRQTFERFSSICPVENFIVVTSKEYIDLVLAEIPEISSSQILAEPFRRNTGPCIAYSNSYIRSKNPNATIVVTPADHLIINEDEFVKAINKGVEFAGKNEILLTLGIKPHKPETGYGYIQIGEEIIGETIFNKVKTFTEKPNIELATIFFESKEFLWNSGIFIWSLKSIDNAFDSLLPEVQTLFRKLDTKIGTDSETKALNETYSECKNISIDYGVLEKAENVVVQTTSFGWSDLGTWTSLYEYSAQDNDLNSVINGKAMLYETKNSIVHLPSDKIAVIQGLDNYIVVDSGKELLICPKSNEQQIRQFTIDISTEFGDNHI